MPGYVFMHADVTDPGGYEEFKTLAAMPSPITAAAT